MDEDKKDMPDMQGCGCSCEKCMGDAHSECPTGMCQMGKKDNPMA